MILGIDRTIRPLPANVVDLFTVTTSIVGDVIVGVDEYDASTAAQWFESILSEAVEAKDRAAAFSEVRLTHLLMSAELCQLKAWRRFSDLAARLLKGWRRESTAPATLSLSEGSFSMAMSLEILGALNENTLLIDGAQLDSASILASESTSFPALDAITGCQGVPLGDITLFSGRTTSGKLTLAYKTLMNARPPTRMANRLWSPLST